MKGLFNYDSPFMQALMYLADLIIINVLFLVCCIPVFTIGAAQSGLYNAVRVMQDKDDDSSCASAFFRGFRNGFKRITLVWLVFLVIYALLFYNLIVLYLIESIGMAAPVVFSIVGICICGLIHTVMTLFHSRFDCTIRQLLRNAILVTLAHPLRCLLAALLAWSPVLFLLLDFRNFIALVPVFLSLWFSVTYLFGYTCLKKPFQKFVEAFQAKQAQPEAPTEETLPADTAPADTQEALPAAETQEDTPVC